MMSFKCLECQQSFDSERSLHAHIKKHDMFLHGYYVKHFQRKDLLTGDLLPFKNKEQYFSCYFLNQENQHKFFEQEKMDCFEPQMVLLEMLTNKTKEGICPSEIILTSYGLPSIHVFKKFFGSYTHAGAGAGGVPFLNSRLPKDFSRKVNAKIFIDTREQQPLSFPQSESLKLDLGDYGIENQFFDYTFVDRKSEGDFKSTLSQDNYERFRRELQRAREQDCFIFVVVESDFNQIERNNIKSKHQANLAYIYHNMRALQLEFKDCCQFAMTSNRENSVKLIPRLLMHGRKLWNVDLQYYINEGLLNGLD
jgi:hypothetical protein